MKYLLFLVCLLVPSISFAQINTLGVYTEPVGLTCWTHDTPGPHTLYVIMTNTLGVTGARFRIETSSGFTGTLLSSSSPWSNVTGDPVTGAIVTFDSCEPAQFIVMTLDFMFIGGSSDCSWIRTAKHPAFTATGPEVYDCQYGWSPAYWEGTHVSNSFPTNCANDIRHEEHIHFCRPYSNPTVAADASTWGAVKALYR